MINNKKTVWLLCLNDFHAEILESDYAPGSAKVVEAVRRFKETHENTFVLFGGDNYKGDPISESLEGSPVTQMMSLLETRASALGNHEFDYGTRLIEEWQREGKYAFLGANVFYSDSGKAVDFAKKYIMLEAGGIRIAVIGLSLQEPLDTVDRPQEMHKIQIRDGIAAAKEIISEIGNGGGQEKKPAAIVALTHFGLKYAADGQTVVGDEVIRLCKEVPQLDGVFTAHFHRFMCLDIHGIPVVQGGSQGRGIAVLRLDFAGNRLDSVTPSVISLTDIPDLTPDAAMEKIVEQSRKKAMEKLGVVVAHIESAIEHRSDKTGELDPEGSPLSALAIDVMLEASGCEIAMLYAGRMGRGLPAGQITLHQLYQALIFENGIVTMDLPGHAILSNVEKGICTLKGESVSPLAFGGLMILADYSRPYGNRVVRITQMDGTPLEPDKYYTVAIDNYLVENPMGFDFTAGINVVYTTKSVRGCMVDRIRKTGTIPAEFVKTIHIENKVNYYRLEGEGFQP